MDGARLGSPDLLTEAVTAGELEGTGTGVVVSGDCPGGRPAAADAVA